MQNTYKSVFDSNLVLNSAVLRGDGCGNSIQINIKVIFLDEYTFQKTEEEFLKSIEANKFNLISYTDNLIKNKSQPHHLSYKNQVFLNAKNDGKKRKRGRKRNASNMKFDMLLGKRKRIML